MKKGKWEGMSDKKRKKREKYGKRKGKMEGEKVSEVPIQQKG